MEAQDELKGLETEEGSTLVPVQVVRLLLVVRKGTSSANKLEIKTDQSCRILAEWSVGVTLALSGQEPSFLLLVYS